MLAYYLVIVMMVSVLFSYVGPNPGGVLGFATDIKIEELMAKTNEERSTHGLQVLSYNAQLSEAATQKAHDMFTKNYWAHFAPDGTSPWSFILGSGYQYELAGENLAKNFVFSSGVVEAWMNSPSHRANILKPEYTEVGYAVVNGTLNGEETTLVVQMFAKSLTQSGSLLTQKVQAAETVMKQADNKQVVTVPEVASNQETATVVIPNSEPYTAGVNTFPAFFGINMLFFAFIGLVLIFDLIYAAKLNILHLNGKHITHLLYIGFIAAGISMVILKGAIL